MYVLEIFDLLLPTDAFPYSQVAKGSDLYRANKSTKLCMVVA